MARRQNTFTTISLEELVYILQWTETNDAALAFQKQVTQRLEMELPGEPSEPDPERDSFQARVQKRYRDFLTLATAKRLRRNRHDAPLFNKQDMKQAGEEIIAEASTLISPEEMDEDPEMLELATNVLRQFFTNLVEQASLIPRSDPKPQYEHWERRVSAIIRLAEKRGLGLKEFLALPEASDLLTKELVTRKQFVADIRKAFGSKSPFLQLVAMAIANATTTTVHSVGRELGEPIEDWDEKKQKKELRVYMQHVRKIVLEVCMDEADRLWPRKAA